MKISLRLLLISSITLTIAGCGGGGFSTAEGGISGSGISYGRTSDVNDTSVVVNGTELSIDTQSVITVDEQSATPDDLRIGHLIRVEADFDNSRVIRLDYTETVRGPLTSPVIFNPDTLIGSFTLLGQSVITNASTVFEPNLDISLLVTDDVLDVSGIRNSSGSIVASFISQKTLPVNEYRVVGKVSNLTENTFVIGGLTIKFDTADLSDLNGGTPTAGVEVRARGPVGNFDSATGTLIATVVKNSVLSLNPLSNDSIEVEGVTTVFTSLSDFEVNGLTVDASNAVFVDGINSDIKIDAELEIEGKIDSGGVLVADEVKIKQPNTIRIEALVESVDSANNQVFVLGIPIQVNASTQLEDYSGVSNPLTLSNLQSGNRVEIRAYLESGNVIASRLERTDDPTETRVRLQAPVDVVGIDTVTLLGRLLNTNGDTSYEDLDDSPLSTKMDFFNLLEEGKLVKATWKGFTDITLAVDELSLESQ